MSLPTRSRRYHGGEQCESGKSAFGDPISREDVMILGVANEKAPMEVIQQRFPNARFAQEDFVLASINSILPKTKNDSRIKFARPGCARLDSFQHIAGRWRQARHHLLGKLAGEPLKESHDVIDLRIGELRIELRRGHHTHGLGKRFHQSIV